MKLNFTALLLPLILVGGLVASCKKYENPPQKFEEYDQEEEKTVSRKVLVISMDGLVGEQLQDDVPTNIASMMETAKYSFQALTDENTSDAATWTTMMTGYHSGKHHVLDEN